MTDQITPSQFHEAEGVEVWRLTSEGATAFFRTRSFGESARFVQAISELQEVEEHRPGVDMRHDGVTVHVITYTDTYFGPSQKDVELARQISVAARKMGLTADPSAIQSLLIIPGATNIAEVMPFWRAVLGYEPRHDSPNEDLVDPHDRGAPFWFEQMNEPRGGGSVQDPVTESGRLGGGAIHVAIWVPYEQAEARVAAALAAGGRLVRDEFAPSWWTLADAAGNEADIATVKGRD
jgi:4a-hydroxytetrahydrobiopterin dehydratase